MNIVGNQGWWTRKSKIPPYDQQPVDAASVVLASLQAYIATGEKHHIAKAQIAYNWYLGENINNLPLYNEKTEGCHDALVPHGVNLNQGAEAVISFLMAHQVLESIKAKSKGINPGCIKVVFIWNRKDSITGRCFLTKQWNGLDQSIKILKI